MSDASDHTVSPPTGPRGRPKDPAKRAAILDAAKVLFLSQGYAGTSMDAVATEAGVSKLTVYSHFSDKENLFSAAVESKCEDQMPMPMFSLERGDDLEAVLERIGRAFVELIYSDEAIGLERLMTSQATQDPDMSRLFFEAGPQRTLDVMAKLLGKAQELGVVRIPDLDAAAQLFFGMLQSCGHKQVLIGFGEPPTASEARVQVKEVVRVFMAGYRA